MRHRGGQARSGAGGEGGKRGKALGGKHGEAPGGGGGGGRASAVRHRGGGGKRGRHRGRSDSDDETVMHRQPGIVFILIFSAKIIKIFEKLLYLVTIIMLKNSQSSKK